MSKRNKRNDLVLLPSVETNSQKFEDHNCQSTTNFLSNTYDKQSTKQLS